MDGSGRGCLLFLGLGRVPVWVGLGVCLGGCLVCACSCSWRKLNSLSGVCVGGTGRFLCTDDHAVVCHAVCAHTQHWGLLVRAQGHLRPTQHVQRKAEDGKSNTSCQSEIQSPSVGGVRVLLCCRALCSAQVSTNLATCRLAWVQCSAPGSPGLSSFRALCCARLL
jgi:hypothetical protein